MAALTVEEKKDKFISHALKIRSSWSLCNYHSFFQLYSAAPNMGGYLLDLFVEREREKAMKILVKSWVLSFFLFKWGGGVLWFPYRGDGFFRGGGGVFYLKY